MVDNDNVLAIGVS